jgi:hypothetical protein
MAVPLEMPQQTWSEIEYHQDVCSAKNGVHIVIFYGMHENFIQVDEYVTGNHISTFLFSHLKTRSMIFNDIVYPFGYVL